MRKTYLMPITIKEINLEGEIFDTETIDLNGARVTYMNKMASQDKSSCRVIIDTDDKNHEIIASGKNVKCVDDMDSTTKLEEEKKFEKGDLTDKLELTLSSIDIIRERIPV